MPREWILTPEERSQIAVERMSLGSLKGRVKSSAPVRPKASALVPRMASSSHNHMGSGTDSTIVSGLLDSTQADAQGIQSTAGGDGAIAKGDYSLALGDGADTEEAYGTALGHNTFIGAGATSGTAVGNQASVRAGAAHGSAFGDGAKVDTGHDSSTAIGRNATTTASNQIMLGTVTETVVIPGTLNASGGITLPNDSVSYAQMQNVSAASRLLGRGSAAGAGDPEEIVLGTNLSMSGTTLNATGGGGTAGTPALTFGTTNATGAASTFVATDATIALFDATAPTTQAFGDAAAVGTAGTAARRDHKHAWPTAAVTTSGLTQSTAKMLGRSTAATGAIEEIAVGSGLSLSAGSLTVSGSGAAHGCRVYNNTTQSINSATDTLLTFNSEDDDTDAYHSVSSATSRITIPAGLGGLYDVMASVGFDANATGARFVRFLVNGAATNGGEISAKGVVTYTNNVMVGTHLRLTAGDYVEVNVYQDSGAPLNSGSATNFAMNCFSAYLIGT